MSEDEKEVENRKFQIAMLKVQLFNDGVTSILTALIAVSATLFGLSFIPNSPVSSFFASEGMYLILAIVVLALVEFVFMPFYANEHLGHFVKPQPSQSQQKKKAGLKEEHTKKTGKI